MIIIIMICTSVIDVRRKIGQKMTQKAVKWNVHLEK